MTTNAGVPTVGQEKAGAEKASVEKVGVGCIGVGGRGFGLLKYVLNVPGVEVRAVCDSDLENCERAAKHVVDSGGKKPAIFSDWNELLKADGLQAVTSALPIDLHHQNYLDVIAAGKDLYGEKPMCISLAECNDVVSAAKGSNSIVQIGFQRRADPRFVETMGLVHDGELGDLVEGRIAWSNSWGPLYGWFGQRERSGDWMVEQAVHNWDVMNWANQCKPVRAMGLGRSGLYAKAQPERNVTDYYSALVEYSNGVVVNILHSWVSPGQNGAFNRAFNDEYTRLIGTEAGIDFNTGTLSYRKELDKPDRIAHSFQGEINNTQLALDEFIASVRSRKAPVSNVEHGRDAVLACLLVREAVYRRGVVEAEEIGASG